MVVFLDILIFENFIVNLFLLNLTSQVVRIKYKVFNAVLASLFGVLTAVLGLINKFSFLYNLPFKIIIAIIMILIVYRKRNLLFYIKTTIVYIALSMMLAGFCLFVEYNDNIEFCEYLINYSYKKLLLSVMIIYLVFKRILSYLHDRKSIKNLIYNVEIIYKKNKKSINAFLDTGNELREPATNLPVIIVEKAVFEDVLESMNLTFNIPYQMVDGGFGCLKGFQPEYINIHYDEKIEKKKAIIAFCDSKLSDLDDYNALLSRALI
ncbi:sigma-E processing peptidase SpoIIGA [Clostridium sediminicola]|uniref:sigma-E processing peptidase SpoIIGA n=1 Tax=Clostridium sediminicola TaxID=3114879 RepID=UPI0031F25A3D